MISKKQLTLFFLCLFMSATLLIIHPTNTYAKVNLGKTIKVGKTYKETLTNKKYKFVYHFTAPKNGYYDFVYKNPKYTIAWEELVISGLSAKNYEKKTDACPDYGAYIKKSNGYKLTCYVKKGKKYYVTVKFMKEAFTSGDKVTFKLSKHQHDWALDRVSKNKIYYECESCGLVFNTTLKATASTDTLVYNGSEQSPWVKFSLAQAKVTDTKHKTTEKVTLDESYLPKAKFYTISSPKSKNVGSYKLKVTFKGDYKGLSTLTFPYTIIPSTSAIQEIDSNADEVKANAPVQVKLSWKKVTKQTSGYQIQYATNTKFKDAKTITISKNTTTKYTIKDLKFSSKCYFRIRTYKKVDKKKFYSDWSRKVESISH